jgi:hypothetical protein
MEASRLLKRANPHTVDDNLSLVIGVPVGLGVVLVHVVNSDGVSYGLATEGKPDFGGLVGSRDFDILRAEAKLEELVQIQ